MEENESINESTQDVKSIKQSEKKHGRLDLSQFPEFTIEDNSSNHRYWLYNGHKWSEIYNKKLTQN